MIHLLRRICVLACVCLPLLVAVEDPGTTHQLTVAKHGNVRYGPSLLADVVVTLPPESQVESFGEVEGHPGWYEIRFPRTGFAWIHTKDIIQTGDENVFRVIKDAAQVRSDSRKDAHLVTELAVGDEVAWTGKTVGEWRSVYPANAKSYIHQSVLVLNRPQGSHLVAAVTPPTTRTDPGHAEILAAWEDAKEVYRVYRERWQEDPREALDLDWPGLAAKLRRVVEAHPMIKVQLDAKKLLTAIEQVVLASKQSSGAPAEVAVTPVPTPKDPVFTEPSSIGPGVQDPVVAVNDPAMTVKDPAMTVKDPAMTVKDPAMTVKDPGTAVATPVVSSKGPDMTGVGDPKPITVDPEQLYELREPEGYIKGWIMQLDDIGIGSIHALQAKSGEVICYLKVKPGTDVSLSDYVWRRVGIKGEESEFETDAKKVKVVNVTAIRLLDR